MITVALDPASYPAETLLGHQEFVRKLARSLLRDDDAAFDVEQETWLIALKRAPRSVESMQAWLGSIVRNRAHNRRREIQRRSERERISARHEADESDEILRDRVALAHAVVQAVLSLREPYRAIVILRYYENLSPRQIAARKNIPSSTVRVQLSRAHEILRAKLDALRDGDRASWSVALSALVGKPAVGISVLKAVMIAACCAVAVGIPLWMLRRELPTPSPMLAGSVPEPRAVAPMESDIVPEGSQATTGTREPIAPATPSTQGASGPEVASKSVRELLELAVQSQRTIRNKLLTPDERFLHEQENLLRLPSTGLARILERGRFGTDESNLLRMRGGGCYYSFVTHKQGQFDEPDLALDKGALRPQGANSVLLELGELRIEDLPESPTPTPAMLDEARTAAWTFMWADAHPDERGVDAQYAQGRRNVRSPASVEVGHSYLLRAYDYRTHDVLVAFTLLQQDDNGCTIAWRIMRTWPASNQASGEIDPYWWVEDAPSSVASLDVDALTSLLARIRAAGRTKLLAAPAEIARDYSKVLTQAQTGVARLLASDHYDALFEGAGGGAYFSFVTGASERTTESDIALTRFGYSPAYLYGDVQRYLLDVGVTPLEMISEPFDPPRADLSQRDQERWRFLVDCSSPEKGQRNWKLPAADGDRAKRLEFGQGVRPDVGHTYLVRSIMPGRHDVLAAFTTAAMDDAGTWIVWRVLRNRSLREDEQPR